MKTLILSLAVLIAFASNPAHAQMWNESPANWKNSEANWENSSANWKNSSANWQNSSANMQSQNGVYSPDGDRIGYAVPKSDGGVNIYSNDGERIGYQPGY